MRLHDAAVLTLVFASSLTHLAAAQNGVIRVNSRLVQVDVIVRDKNGPIPDLTVEDFTILDNGKAQRIDVFSVAKSRTAQEPQDAPRLPPGGVSNRLYDRREVSTTPTVILVDLLNTPVESQEYARLQLVEYLHSVKQQDRVAIFVLDNDLRVFQNFTGDSEALVGAAGKIPFTSVAGIDLKPTSELSENLSIRGAGPDIAARNANAMTATYVRTRASTTTDALESIAKHLGGLPGRKNLIWMSGGFPYEAEFVTVLYSAKETPVDFGALINGAAQALSEAEVTIYPIDVRALPAPEAVKNSRGVSLGESLKSLPPADTMRRFAAATGGRIFEFKNDLGSAVGEAVSDGEASYTLGFYPPEKSFDGKFHKITVRVARKDVDVFHRSGYAAATNKPLTERQREALLAELAGSPLNASQLGLAASTTPDRTRAGGFVVSIFIDAVDLALDQRGDRHSGTVHLAFRLESSKSRTVKIVSIPLNLTEDQYRSALRNGLLFEEMVPASPGDRLRIVVQDQATGLAGSLWVPLDR